MAIERERVLAAVNYLIQAPHFGALTREITDAIEKWHTRPMVYAGDMACLNALIDIGVQDREAYEKLLELAAAKRQVIPELKRVDYQRKLMQERRDRQAKSIELHELITGKKVEWKDRAQFIKDLQARWMKERNAYIASRGNLSWEARNAAAADFWEQLDKRLEQNLEEARSKKLVSA